MRQQTYITHVTESLIQSAQVVAATAAVPRVQDVITVSAGVFESLLEMGLIEYRHRCWHYTDTQIELQIDGA